MLQGLLSIFFYTYRKPILQVKHVDMFTNKGPTLS